MYELILLKDAEDWLFSLPLDQQKEMLILVRMLRKLGYELQQPFTKSLTGTKEKIKELRCRRFGNRLYYMHHNNKIYVGLLGGNKGSQKQDIKKADKQARKIKKGEVELMKSIDQIMQDRLTEKQINSINKEADKRIDEYLILKQSIARELNNYIESNYLTFNDVKKGLETSTSQTQRILKGESGFTLETLIKVGRFLGKSPRIIFE